MCAGRGPSGRSAESFRGARLSGPMELLWDYVASGRNLPGAQLSPMSTSDRYPFSRREGRSRAAIPRTTAPVGYLRFELRFGFSAMPVASAMVDSAPVTMPAMASTTPVVAFRAGALRAAAFLAGAFVAA